MKLAKELEYLNKLGEGAYGCVYKGRISKTGDIVAIKMIRVSPDEEGVSSTTLRQITILQNLSHPNVIKLFQYRVDYQSSDPKIELIFEYMDEDLAKKMRISKKLDPNLVRVKVGLSQKIMKQIVQGIQYIHSKNVFHRDLKPQNILINAFEEVKIADFGLGRIVGKRLQTMSKEIETLWYRAPELLLGTTKYDMAVDIWSIGCIFYELSEGKVLFQTESQIGQIMEILKICGTPHLSQWSQIAQLPNFKPTFPKFYKFPLVCNNLSQQGIDLLECMIKVNPFKRINIKDVLSHPYFKEF